MRHHHDTEHGVHTSNERELFEYFCLEINQAGLSWAGILGKRVSMRRAWLQFDPDRIAKLPLERRAALRHDARLVRNRLKINAILYNADIIHSWHGEGKSFSQWLDQQHFRVRHEPEPLSFWVDAFKAQFKFVGSEIVREFLCGIGYLKGAHDANCPRYQEILRHATPPRWSPSVEPPHAL